MFLTKLTQKLLSDCSGRRGKQLYVQDFDDVSLYGSVQLELLTIDPDPRFVKRNLIWTRITGRL